MIDLHVHSRFSDGNLSPEELVAAACGQNLAALALTDHDSTDGVPRFLAACAESARSGYRDGQGLEGIAGVELSIDVPRGTLHMLGYFVDPAEPGLQTVLERIRDGRECRNQQILKRLNDVGVALTWDDVVFHAGEDMVGRPHFAQAMVKKGIVKDTQQAFERYLAKGKSAYFDRYRLSPEEAIRAIAQAGGVPVLAHPCTLQVGKAELKRRVAELRDVGLQGIEVYYSEHSDELVGQYLVLARALGLAVTGGSDFHGVMNPAIRLGTGFGSLHVPDELLVDLKSRARNAMASKT